MIKLNREQRKDLYKFRFNAGKTRIQDFSSWNVAWNRMADNKMEDAWNDYVMCTSNLDCPKEAVPTSVECIKPHPWTYINTVVGKIKKQEETETTMRYGDQSPCAPYACASIAQVSPETSEQKAQQYLLSSLEQAIWTKRDEESKAFYMNGTAPQTLGELREAIKNGWVTIPEDYKDDDDDMSLIFGVFSYVSISDPSKKSDPKGFEKARNMIKLDADGVRDQIMVMGSELGLKALNEFKAKTYH